MGMQLKTGNVDNGRYGIVLRLGFRGQYKEMIDRLREKMELSSAEEVLQRAVYDFAHKNGVAAPTQQLPSQRDSEQLLAQGLIATEEVESIQSGRVWARRNGLVYVELVLFYEKQERWFHRLMEVSGLTEGQIVTRAVFAFYEQQG